MADDHAFLASSAADIWGIPDGCPAYPRMALAYSDENDSPEAREGTAAHEYVSTVLMGTKREVGDLAANGHPVTDEMVECAQALFTDVASWRPGCGHRFGVEERLHMPSVHPTLNWGTADIIGANFTIKRLYVRDYKFGHKYVDAWENRQLVDYAIGAFRHFAISPEDIPNWTVDTGIFQPRCWHPEGPRKLWEVTGARFLELADDLAYRARKASDPNAEFHTGDYCTYCPARYACPALRAAGGASVDLSMQGIPHDLTPDMSGLIRAHIVGAIDRLKALQSGVDAQIEAYIRKGQRVPGCDLQPGGGREYWTKPLDEVFMLGDLFGKDLRKKDALTPKQARDLGIDETVISAYSDRRRGELKVVAVQDNTAAKAFK